MIVFYRPLATTQWEKNVVEDLMSFADNRGKRFFSNEIPERCQFLELTKTSVVWATKAYQQRFKVCLEGEKETF